MFDPVPINRLRDIGRRAVQLEALVFVGILLLCCGCSSFNREWRKLGKAPTPPESIEGRWEGRWLSDANGHNGKLRCLLSSGTNGAYTAWFRATYMSVFTFSYRVPLQVESSNALWHFQGSEDLGKLAGGVYHYEGSATLTNFHSTYNSSYDHGTFEMSRP